MDTLSNILCEFTNKQYFSGNWVKRVLNEFVVIDRTFILRCAALSFEKCRAFSIKSSLFIYLFIFKVKLKQSPRLLRLLRRRFYSLVSFLNYFFSKNVRSTRSTKANLSIRKNVAVFSATWRKLPEAIHGDATLRRESTKAVRRTSETGTKFS